MIRPLRPMCALTLAISIVAGCQRSVSIESWQKGLEQSVAKQESGDLSFLRDRNSESSLRQFTVIGAPSPENSTDVTGVLMGRRAIDDRQWMIFLVGSVRKRIVHDIRVAMLSDDGGSPRQWLVSRSDPEALKTYLRDKNNAWRALHPGRTEPPTDALSFPTEDDMFQLEVAGNTISVIHPKSGARWTLVTSDSKRK